MPTRTRASAVLAVGLALALSAAACSNKQSETTSGGGGGGSTPGSAVSGSFTVSTDKCDSYNGTQGVTDSEIVIGSSFPQSGLYAPFAEISKGWEAYFKSVNASGGLNGKQIRTVTKDDGYESGRTKTNVGELIEQEKVFALFNIVGTANNKAIRTDLNKSCVPDLFVATGSQLWGQPERYPWVIGSIPSYATEAGVFADYLKQNKPNAKVGVLRQNDDFGDGYNDAFKKAIEGTSITIVDEETYDPGQADVESQITKIQSSGADTVLLAVTTLTCPNAVKSVAGKTGWDPTTYVSATCASKTLIGAAGSSANGVLTAAYLKDPVDPQWDNDPAMQAFQTTGAQYGLTPEDLENGLVGYGWTMGQLLVETLKGAPKLDRASVMTQAWNLKGLTPGLLLPGITVNTNGPQDPYPIEQMQIGKYNGQYWELQGQVISFEGRSKDFVPDKGQ